LRALEVGVAGDHRPGLALGEEVLSLDIEASLAARSARGGTAPERVAEQREAARERLRAEAG
jgi:argininosuccinate lyase